MWWDDAWVALAFLADVAWLVAAILEQPISDGEVIIERTHIYD